tara:strand:+ start:403 stop:1155 length:753 start_codon:yes stop_codon:yes gene_type:complete
MKKYLGVLILVLSVCFTACDKDDDQNGVSIVQGCTDETAFNYDSNATEDDGSCIAVIEGCTDELAYNYNANANTDDGNCDYSSASLLDGQWNISLLEYSPDISAVDVSTLPQEIADIWVIISVLLETSGALDGEAVDAGGIELSYEDYSYMQILAFSTEATQISIPFGDTFDIPSIPIEINSEGTWTLVNNDSELIFIDSDIGFQQVCEIQGNISSNYILLNVNIELPIDFPGFESFNIPVNLVMHLEPY